MSSSFAKRLFVLGGAPALVRAVKRSRLRILMYHRFPGEATSLLQCLSSQFNHLRKHFHPISLGDAASLLAAGRPLPPRALAITVDDGYGDFRTAWPLFRRFALPVTLFVVPRFLDRQLWLWPDVLQYCFQMTPRKYLDWNLPAGPRAWNLETQAGRALAEQQLGQALIDLPDAARRAAIEQFPAMMEVSLPAAPPERYAALDWEELRAMSHEGLDVGAHTLTHPIVARLETGEQVRREIIGSKIVIENRLDRPVHHFCYPNGLAADFNEDCRAAVREGGFRCAVSAIRGLNSPQSDLFALRRIGVDPSRDPATFALEAAGFRMS